MPRLFVILMAIGQSEWTISIMCSSYVADCIIYFLVISWHCEILIFFYINNSFSIRHCSPRHSIPFNFGPEFAVNMPFDEKKNIIFFKLWLYVDVYVYDRPSDHRRIYIMDISEGQFDWIKKKTHTTISLSSQTSRFNIKILY